MARITKFIPIIALIALVLPDELSILVLSATVMALGYMGSLKLRYLTVILLLAGIAVGISIGILLAIILIQGGLIELGETTNN